ncbi:MAG TPA: gamma-glutamyl-gamma-aminobutyrate hydrolase family protein [Puia sp.]|nr:gamma-glutamyl-gamma-aminobutyrate hydrolase family protein [Puia sp.]
MKIGLTYTGTEWKHQNYIRWLVGNSADIEVVRLSASNNNLGELSACDGLVLSGGIDIHPSFYGGPENYPKTPAKGWEKGRDEFELSALKLALGKGLPVLGVCRGLQLINVGFGGTLVQDLGVTGDATHENDKGKDKQHPVRIRSDSLLREVTGEESGIANSAHHQAIGLTAELLRVNCTAPDDTIEGIEWADPAGKPFLLAVQWHPERMFTGGLADAFLYAPVRDRFIQAIGRERTVFARR